MNLVTGSVLSSFTGIFSNHFDTFGASTNGNFCIINKEPIKTVSSYNISVLPGMDNQQIDESYTFVSGIYPCIIVKDFKKEHMDKVDNNLNLKKSNFDLKIKLNTDGYNYMESGATQNIIVENKIYKKFSLDKIQNFFGLKYYYYDLKAVD